MYCPVTGRPAANLRLCAAKTLYDCSAVIRNLHKKYVKSPGTQANFRSLSPLVALFSLVYLLLFPFYFRICVSALNIVSPVPLPVSLCLSFFLAHSLALALSFSLSLSLSLCLLSLFDLYLYLSLSLSLALCLLSLFY